MLHLQALWDRDGRLLVWAEDTVRARDPRPARGRKAKNPTRKPHPFAASVEAIRETLGPFAGPAQSTQSDRWGETDCTLWLPTAPRGPVASTERAVGAQRVWLAPWTVPAIALTARDAMAMLVGGFGDARVGSGGTLRYFATVAKLATELVAGGRVVPALVAESPRPAPPVARWRPQPSLADRERLLALANAMPAACRAQAAHGRDGAPASALLEDSFSHLVDASVRRSVGERLLPPRRGRKPRSVPAEEWFVEALCGDDPTVASDPEELDLLAKELDTWRASAGDGVEGPLRTCFRLWPPDEPGDGTGAWWLEFLLQDVEDPSLLVPAGDVWGNIVPETFIAHPQDHLLEDLGRASRVYPELEAGLANPRPEVMELDADGALAFLSLAAPLLQDAGFGVLVPKTWDGHLRVRVRASSSSPADAAVTTQSRLGARQLIDYDWEIALGEDTLTEDELRTLAEVKAPLVHMHGRWVHVRPDEIKRALAVLERQERGDGPELTVVDLVHATVGLSDLDTGLPVEAEATGGWLADFFGGEDGARFEPRPTPESFHGELRPYQERGLGWLGLMDRHGLGACLADDMGLGKTIQLLALLLTEREDREPSPGPTLLVCPMSVVGNWQREADRFAPSLRVYVHHGGGRAGDDEFGHRAAGADLVLTTYALTARDVELLRTVRWHRIVLDEAQNIKNSRAKQSRAVRSLPAGARVALTGTPIENRLSELWSILEFLNPGWLGPAETFRKCFAVPIERYGDNDAAEMLRTVTAPLILRRVKTDKAILPDLPEKTEIKAYCNLTREQATLYQAVVDEMLVKVAESEGIERRGRVLATILRLKQVCNHPAHFLGDGSALSGRSGKLAHLEDIVDEVLAVGEKVLVFTQFAEMGALLARHLPARFGCDTLFLHGGTPRRARDLQIESFASPDGPALFVLSLKAGGVGLNLTAANHVVHFDRWWNPAVEDQASDRAFRIGQRKDVQVRKLICTGTFEERIDELIEAKKDLAARIVGAGEDWLTELTTDELRAVIELSRDAVAED